MQLPVDIGALLEEGDSGVIDGESTSGDDGYDPDYDPDAAVWSH